MRALPQHLRLPLSKQRAGFFNSSQSCNNNKSVSLCWTQWSRTCNLLSIIIYRQFLYHWREYPVYILAMLLFLLSISCLLYYGYFGGPFHYTTPPTRHESQESWRWDKRYRPCNHLLIVLKGLVEWKTQTAG